MEKKEKISAIIAARMGSSRFPGKTLANLYGKPMLGRLIERIRYSKYIDEIIVATTILKEDMDIESWCCENDVKCFRGDEKNVLRRLNDTVAFFNCQVIVEILGDNPLVHSDTIDAAVETYFLNGADYIATLTNEYPKADKNLKRFPIGVRVQVFSIDTIVKCAEMVQSDHHKEHATSFIAENPEIFKTYFIQAKGPFSNCNRPELTFAVNQKKNLVMINNIFSTCYPFNDNFTLDEAIEQIDKNSSWLSLMGN